MQWWRKVSISLSRPSLRLHHGRPECCLFEQCFLELSTKDMKISCQVTPCSCRELSFSRKISSKKKSKVQSCLHDWQLWISKDWKTKVTKALKVQTSTSLQIGKTCKKKSGSRKISQHLRSQYCSNFHESVCHSSCPASHPSPGHHGTKLRPFEVEQTRNSMVSWGPIWTLPTRPVENHSCCALVKQGWLKNHLSKSGRTSSHDSQSTRSTMNTPVMTYSDTPVTCESNALLQNILLLCDFLAELCTFAKVLDAHCAGAWPKDLATRHQIRWFKRTCLMLFLKS